MTTLKTSLNARSAEFRTNSEAMTALVADLRAKIDQVAGGGGEAARAKHVARGKLLPREEGPHQDNTIDHRCVDDLPSSGVPAFDESGHDAKRQIMRTVPEIANSINEVPS